MIKPLDLADFPFGDQEQELARDDNGREHGDQNAQGQSQGEALDDGSAEKPQNGAGDERRGVGIADGSPGAGKAVVNRSHQLFAGLEFFLHPFKNQNVGVNRHTDGQNEPGDSGQS